MLQHGIPAEVHNNPYSMYSGDFLLPANYTAGVMPDPKSKFDVRGDSFLAHCKHTIVFAAYVLQTFLAWVFLGGLVRRAYRKARKEGRLFYVDRLPSGKNSQ